MKRRGRFLNARTSGFVCRCSLVVNANAWRQVSEREGVAQRSAALVSSIQEQADLPLGAAFCQCKRLETSL